MNLLKLTDLTILIPTFNRNKFLLRNLDFWENFQTNIIILDASKKKIKSKILSKYKNNIIYFYNKNLSFEKRLYLGSKKIFTKYCVLLGDDEIVNPWFLKKGMKFLKKNNSFGCCIGRCVGFSKFHNHLYLWPEKQIQANHQVNQKSCLNRAKYHLSNFTPSSLYGLHRKKSFQFSTHLFDKFNFSSPYVQETLFELLSSFFGKGKVFKDLFWFRSFENFPINNQSNPRLYSFYDWWNDKKNKKQKKLLLSELAKSLNIKFPKKKINIFQFLKIILEKKANTDYLSKQELYDRFNKNFFDNIKKKLLYLRQIIKYLFINFNFRNFCFYRSGNNYNYSLLKDSQINYKLKELNYINSFLTNYDIKN
jgi:glycosyltransferase domain-containing protein